MNIKFLITAAVAAISISVFAQRPPAGGPPAGGQRGGPGQGMRRGGWMNDAALQKELNLTDAQKTKIKAIQDSYRDKFRAAFGGPPGGARPGGAPGGAPGQRPPMDPAKVKQLMALRDAQMKEINKVLNAKQQAALKKWQAAHPPRFGGPGGPGGAGAKGGGKSGGGH